LGFVFRDVDYNAARDLPMNEKRATLTLILALVFLSVSAGGICGSPKNKLEAYTDSEGYAVVSQLLDSDAKGWKNTLIRLEGLTVSRTEMAHESLRTCTELPGEFQAAAKDFEGKTQQHFALRKMFTTLLVKGAGGWEYVGGCSWQY
jgi:hypothetical protein